MNKLTYNDVWNLAEACRNEQAKVFILISSSCWLKPSKILQLKYSDVEMGGLMRPDGKFHQFPLKVRLAIDALRKSRKGDVLVFQSRSYDEEKPVSDSFIRKKVSLTLRATEIDYHRISLESFRKLWGREIYLNAGADKRFETLKDLHKLIQSKDLTQLASYLGVKYHGIRGRSTYANEGFSD